MSNFEKCTCGKLVRKRLMKQHKTICSKIANKQQDDKAKREWYADPQNRSIRSDR